MSFEDFKSNSVDALAARGMFQHSQQVLPLPSGDTTDSQKAGHKAQLAAVQSEIAAKFDNDYTPCTTQMAELIARSNSYRTSGVMLPLRLFQAECYMMGHLASICQAYQTDADLLARLGATDFQTYLKKLSDDATQALVAMKNSSAAGMPGPGLEPEVFFAALHAGRSVLSDGEAAPPSSGDAPDQGPMSGWHGLAAESVANPTGGSLPFAPSPPFARNDGPGP